MAIIICILALSLWIGWRFMRRRRIRRRRRINNYETAADVTCAAHTPEFVAPELESDQDQAEEFFDADSKSELDDSDECESDSLSDGYPDQNKIKTDGGSKHQPERFIQLYVMADAGCSYSGYELLQTLLAVGMRFGDRQIFHRYIKQDPNLGSWFSLASVNKPGTFELGSIGGFSCDGFILFMADGMTPYNAAALRKMLSTAEMLVEELGGEIWGPNRQPLSMADIDDLFYSLQEKQAVFDNSLVEAES